MMLEKLSKVQGKTASTSTPESTRTFKIIFNLNSKYNLVEVQTYMAFVFVILIGIAIVQFLESIVARDNPV